MVTAVILVAAVFLLIAGMLLLRRTTKLHNSSKEEAEDKETGWMEVPRVPRPRSPLETVTFNEAIQSDALTKKIREYAPQRFAYELGLDPANIVIQTISLAKDRRSLTIAYKFSKHGRQRLKSGKAVIPLDQSSSSFLPVLRDKETGRFLELARARRIDPSRWAQVSSLTVSIAHMIAGFDVVSRLEQLDSKIAMLLQGREIDQKAELEKIYQMARERLAGELKQSDLEEMRRWRGELYRLRAIWRDELHNTIKSAPDPDMRLRLEYLLDRRAQKISDHLLSVAKKLLLTKVAFATDLYLAQETGTIDVFLRQTVADEGESWACVKNDLNKLAEKMNSTAGQNVKLLGEAVSAYTNVLRGLNLSEQ